MKAGEVRVDAALCRCCEMCVYLWSVIRVPETSELPELSVTNRLIELKSTIRPSGT